MLSLPIYFHTKEERYYANIINGQYNTESLYETAKQ